LPRLRVHDAAQDKDHHGQNHGQHHEKQQGVAHFGDGCEGRFAHLTPSAGHAGAGAILLDFELLDDDRA